MPQLWGARPGRFCPSSGELGSDDEDDDDEDKDDDKEDEGDDDDDHHDDDGGDDDVYIVPCGLVSLTPTAGIRCELARVSCNGLAAHCGLVVSLTLTAGIRCCELARTGLAQP